MLDRRLFQIPELFLPHHCIFTLQCNNLINHLTLKSFKSVDVINKKNQLPFECIEGAFR